MMYPRQRGKAPPEKWIKVKACSTIYALVRDGEIINMISWDGVTPYTPPSGCTLVKAELKPDKTCDMSIGKRRCKQTGAWLAPEPVAEQQEQER